MHAAHSQGGQEVPKVPFDRERERPSRVDDRGAKDLNGGRMKNKSLILGAWALALLSPTPAAADQPIERDKLAAFIKKKEACDFAASYSWPGNDKVNTRVVCLIDM